MNQPKLLGLAIAILLTVIFLTNFSLNLDKPIDFSHFDTFHAMYTINHYYRVLEEGNFSQLLNLNIFYGFGNSLLFAEAFLLQAILGLPIYFLTKNIIFTYNFLGLITMIVSFFSMYLLSFYLFKKFWPAVLASVVYVFNPFVFGHFPDNIHYFSLQWIPLIFLFLERSLRERKERYILLFFISLTLQLLSSVTFLALLSVVLPIYTLTRLYQLKLSPLRLINRGAIFGLIVFGIFTIAFGYLYTGYYSKQPIGRTLEETAAYGPWVSDLLFSNPNNLIYGNLRFFALEHFPFFVYNFEENAERNLFWGITPFILFILSFFIFRRSKDNKLWLLFAGMVIFNVLISLGPVIRFSQDFVLPGIYNLFYTINPVLHNLRVASRFSIFTYLFLGLICGLVLKKLTEKDKKRTFISLLVMCLVMLEYFQKPWPFYQIPDQTRSFYSSLESRKDIKVILELPMGNLFTPVTLAKNQFVDATYMFWASTLHSKKLLNGYSSYTPPAYIDRIEYLSVNFPTQNKLEQLKLWGVDAIVLHQNEFQRPEQYEEIKFKFNRLGVREITSLDGLILFSLKDWTKAP